jgi:hypothetical protein
MLTPRLRKFALTAHVTSSVGWLGTAAAFQALAIAAVMSREPVTIRGLYRGMELIGWYVIIPFCLASLVSGLILSLGTPWGLFRHYWVVVKFLITLISTLILFGFTQTLWVLGDLAADPGSSLYQLRSLRQSPVLHSGGGLVAILLATVLAVYKPWGMTPYGRRQRNAAGGSDDGLTAGLPRRPYLLLSFIGLILVLLILHLLQGGPMRH